MDKYFPYGKKEMDYLSARDKRLKEVIDTLGYVQRSVDDCDLFASLMYHIIGQQISTAAQWTIRRRLQDKYPVLDAETIAAADKEDLQSVGITYKKVEYMQGIAREAACGKLNLEELYELSDEEVIKTLSAYKGIGVWTAEMILLFNMQRPDVFSYGDLAILRGIRMVYHHKTVTREMFERYRKRFSPYCSVASIYFWAVAGGAIPHMKDYAPKKKNR